MDLQGHFQGDVAGRAAHDLDEVPVLLGREGVPAHIARQFGVDLGGGVEPEADLDLFVLQVAVDGLGASDDPDAGFMGLEIFGQDRRVGIGVVPTDNHQGRNSGLFQVGVDLLELFRGFQLGSARADDVEPAGVAVLFQQGISDLDFLVFDQARGPA